MMNKFLATLLSTYRQKIKAKSFIITTLLLVLFVFAGMNFDKILNLFDSEDEKTVITIEATEEDKKVVTDVITSFDDTILIEPDSKNVLAKVSAIILVSFTQILIVIGLGLIAFKTSSLQETLSEFELVSNEHTVPIIVYSVVFLVLGLLLYLIFAALLGSFISRMEDLQQGLMPLSFISIGGFYIGLFNIMNSDETLLKISSYVPFFTPYTMPVRLLNLDTPMSVIYIGIAILAISIILLLILTTTVYKRNVLMNDSNMLKSIKKLKNM